jgi:hypothetical protein
MLIQAIGYHGNRNSDFYTLLVCEFLKFKTHMQGVANGVVKSRTATGAIALQRG